MSAPTRPCLDIYTPCTFDVVLYAQNGDVANRQEFADVADALAFAGSTPYSALTIHDAIGWVLHTEVYSPKHPAHRATFRAVPGLRGDR